MANGSHVLVNGDGALASAAVKVAAGDLASVFAANSGYALSESGSSWPSPCQICPYSSYDWASWDCNRTRGRENNCS